jgi:hypothetical protein
MYVVDIYMRMNISDIQSILASTVIMEMEEISEMLVLSSTLA